jgi:hypothetical protein
VSARRTYQTLDSPRSEVGELLEALELRRVPTEASLELHFRRLLKRFHPDLNPDRALWAHEKTRTIIHAARRLRSLLQAGLPAEPDDSSHGSHGRDADESKPARRAEAPGIAAFQLIDAPRVNLALPVVSLVRIVSPGDSCVRKDSAVGGFCYVDREIFPVRTLEGVLPPWSQIAYLALLRSDDERAALAMERNVRFGAIERVALGEILRENPFRKTHGVWLQRRGKSYLCPAEFVEAQLTGRQARRP